MTCANLPSFLILLIISSNSYAGGASSTLARGASGTQKYCEDNSASQCDSPKNNFRSISDLQRNVAELYKRSWRDLNVEHEISINELHLTARTDAERRIFAILESINEDATQWMKSNRKYEERLSKNNSILKSAALKTKLSKLEKKQKKTFAHSELNEKYRVNWLVNNIKLVKAQKEMELIPFDQERLAILTPRIQKEIEFLEELKKIQFERIQSNSVIMNFLKIMSSQKSEEIMTSLKSKTISESQKQKKIQMLQKIMEDTLSEKERLLKTIEQEAASLVKKMEDKTSEMTAIQNTIDESVLTAKSINSPIDAWKRELTILGEYNPFPLPAEEQSSTRGQTEDSQRGSQRQTRRKSSLEGSERISAKPSADLEVKPSADVEGK